MSTVETVPVWEQLLRSGKDGRQDIVLASHDEARAVFDRTRAEVTKAFGPPRDLRFAGAENHGVEWELKRTGFGLGVWTVRLRVGVMHHISSVLVHVEPPRPAHASN
jgi:hypothetical protein